jgi:uncharacterized protein
MKEKVLITGASGQLAQKVAGMLEKEYDLRFLTTHKESENGRTIFYWDVEESFMDPTALKDVSHIIHLSGFSIAKAWTANNKQKMYDSRVKAARLIRQTCKSLAHSPHTVVSASAMGYYGFEARACMSEDAAAGNDWLAHLCVDWEKEVQAFEQLGSRVCVMRLPVLLERNSGFIQAMLPLMKLPIVPLFAGGAQQFPWIHMEDVARFIQHSISSASVRGVYNLSAENHTLSSFLKGWAKSIGRTPILIPIPKWLMQLVLGEKSRMLLANFSLDTERMLSLPFKLKYPQLHKAIEECMGANR